MSYNFKVPADEVKQFAIDNCIACIFCTPFMTADNFDINGSSVSLGCSFPGGQPFIGIKGNHLSKPFDIKGNWVCIDQKIQE